MKNDLLLDVKGDTDMSVVLKLTCTLLLVIINFQVKKIVFVGSDSIGLTIAGKEIASSKETFILSSLWQAKRAKRDIHVRSSKQSFPCLLILMSGDIESCPGPYSRDIPALKQLLKQRGLEVFHQNKDSENNGLYDIPGYSFESRPRNSGKGGGVGAYISNKVPWVRREALEDKELEIMWIEVWPSRKYCKGILIAIMYRPPDSSKYLRKDFNARFNSILTKAAEECIETMILGDANINFRIENDNKKLKSIFSVFGLKQIIAKPTRISETTETLIDVILTNYPSNIAEHDVIPTSIGDHDMPGCVRKINNSSFRPRLYTCQDYKNYNPENMKSDLQNVDWAPFYNQINVNEAWLMMKSILQNIFNHHAPRIFKKVRGKPAPWLNSEEVERELKSIKRNKATGLDDLPPGLIKDLAESISAPLTHLINMSLMTSTFPADWKTAKIIPTHKSGARSSCDNYRPISVLPVLSKDQLVGAFFVDLSKAFDTISHAILLEKLAIHGIKDNELEWFNDYPFSRKAVVAFNGCISDEQNLLTGVPQGSILGP
eukprot:gene8031-13942_t